MKRLIALLPLLALSCASSDMKLVARATAADTYYQQTYAWNCVEIVGPASCGECQAAINDAAKRIPLANTVQKVGPLPAQERAELQNIIRRLEACP